MMLIEYSIYVLLALLSWVVLVTGMLSIVYFKLFKQLWQEPMLRQPVIIFDSDDWGVGSQQQVAALTDLLQLFLHYQDNDGRHPVLALGIILAEPDRKKMAEQAQAENIQQYYARTITDKSYQKLVQLIKKGRQDGVFALHLHGMEHYWPSSLMNHIDDQEVQNWLLNTKDAHTESLPPFLQSRWCDSSTLPSEELNGNDIKTAIAEEVNIFQQVFAQPPEVVVPPTFVWTDAVIKTYIQHNIRLFITPGRQFTGRDSKGDLVSNGRTFYNGQCDKSGACYLVRDIYFEPELGHKAEQVIKEIKTHTSMGRPTLIEMHRFNFLNSKAQSLTELKKLLDNLSQQVPEVLYLSAEQLMSIYQSDNKKILYSAPQKRLTIWIKRIKYFLKYKRLAKYSGFNLILKLA